MKICPLNRRNPNDRKVFAWLQEHMNLEGLPAAMLIVGEDDQDLFVGSIA